MKIEKETVEYVAHLSRIELTKDEVVEFAQQLDAILRYMDQLAELKTENIEPTSHAIEIKQKMREDVVREWFSQKESIMNAPETKGPFFLVPPVIEVEE